MEPTTVAALIDTMAARSRAESESFFVAHGLGAAYDQPGRHASKRASINAAVKAAMSTKPEVLEAAAAAFLGNIADQPGPDSAGEKLTPRSTHGETVFVSHASTDKPLADALVRLMRLGADLSGLEVTYTSHPATGIPTGVPNYMDWLRQRVEGCRLFVALLSPAYMESSTCLLEFGGAWVKGTPAIAFVVPPFDFAKAEKAFGKLNFGRVDSSNARADLFDEVGRRFNKGASTAAWTEEDKKFAAELPGLLARIPETKKVDRADLTALAQKGEAKDQEIDQLTLEVAKLQGHLLEVSALKDSQEAREVVREHSTEMENFDACREAASVALDKLKYHTRRAIYEIWGKGDDLYRPTWDDDVDDAVRASEILFHEDEGGYFLDMADPGVKAAMNAVEDLFVSDWSHTLLEAFAEEHGKRFAAHAEPAWKILGLL
jgi:hypothetical protein